MFDRVLNTPLDREAKNLDKKYFRRLFTDILYHEHRLDFLSDYLSSLSFFIYSLVIK